jgi:hypothetical protein
MVEPRLPRLSTLEAAELLARTLAFRRRRVTYPDTPAAKHRAEAVPDKATEEDNRLPGDADARRDSRPMN